MDRICITQKYQGVWKFQRKVPVISPCRGKPRGKPKDAQPLSSRLSRIALIYHFLFIFWSSSLSKNTLSFLTRLTCHDSLNYRFYFIHKKIWSWKGYYCGYVFYWHWSFTIWRSHRLIAHHQSAWNLNKNNSADLKVKRQDLSLTYYAVIWSPGR